MPEPCLGSVDGCGQDTDGLWWCANHFLDYLHEHCLGDCAYEGENGRWRPYTPKDTDVQPYAR